MVATMKTSNRWLGLLGAVAVMFSASVLASSSGSSSQECAPDHFADGDCDEQNNTAECGYDSGDCCSCTCEDTVSYTCGEFAGFQCVDPAAPCVDDDDVTIEKFENCGSVESIGNGFCDTENNNEPCGYDGGDCCQCTCDSSNASESRGCGWWSGFACIDPTAPCVDDDSVTDSMIDICQAGLIGNGYCDDVNNVEECAYDGGDCCSCTCDPSSRAGDVDACQYGFACIDQSAPCFNDDDITTGMLENCQWIVGVGNGYCDLDMNTRECNYDGGDCCECTCDVGVNGDDHSDGRYSGCNNFACIDPEAPCVGDDGITTVMVENCGDVLGIGNGYCNSENNNELCAYDGGDCCSCTCFNEYDDEYACNADESGFDCKDTNAPCFDEETAGDDNFSFTDDSVMSGSHRSCASRQPLYVLLFLTGAFVFVTP